MRRGVPAGRAVPWARGERAMSALAGRTAVEPRGGAVRRTRHQKNAFSDKQLDHFGLLGHLGQEIWGIYGRQVARPQARAPGHGAQARGASRSTAGLLSELSKKLKLLICRCFLSASGKPDGQARPPVPPSGRWSGFPRPACAISGKRGRLGPIFQPPDWQSGGIA